MARIGLVQQQQQQPNSSVALVQTEEQHCRFQVGSSIKAASKCERLNVEYHNGYIWRVVWLIQNEHLFPVLQWFFY